MDNGSRAELVLSPDPTVKLLPLVRVAIATIGVGFAAGIPDVHFAARVAVAALFIGPPVYESLTVVRRLVVGEEAVDIQLVRKRVCIPYARIARLTVRAQYSSLAVVFELQNPRSVIALRASSAPPRLRGALS
jgi:hypothetical protein